MKNDPNNTHVHETHGFIAFTLRTTLTTIGYKHPKTHRHIHKEGEDLRNLQCNTDITLLSNWSSYSVGPKNITVGCPNLVQRDSIKFESTLDQGTPWLYSQGPHDQTHTTS